MFDKRHFLRSAAGASAALCLPGWAQDMVRPTFGTRGVWPNRPLRLLVGFPAGASPDLAARAIAGPLSQLLGQSVTVENKPGSSGNLAADLVAKARDDHTFGALINGNLTIARLLNKATPFDPETDFSPVGMIGSAPLVLALSAQAAGRTPTELLLWARNLGSNGKYGTPGNGTVGHLGMELLKVRASLRATHVPFTSNPQVIEAMLKNEIQLALLPPALAMAQVNAGKLKAVGVTSPERSPLAGNLPTLREADVRGADLEIWTALAAPSTQPPASVAKLNAALNLVLHTHNVNQALLTSGWEARAGSADEMGKRMRSDTARLGGVIMMRGIKDTA